MGHMVLQIDGGRQGHHHQDHDHINDADLAEQAAVPIQNLHPSASLTISVTGPLPI